MDNAQVSLRSLVAWRDREAARLIASGSPTFLGKPNEWFEHPSWLCANGHVSKRILTGNGGGDRCLGCMGPVVLGPAMSEEALGGLLLELASTGGTIDPGGKT